MDTALMIFCYFEEWGCIQWKAKWTNGRALWNASLEYSRITVHTFDADHLLLTAEVGFELQIGCQNKLQTYGATVPSQ